MSGGIIPARAGFTEIPTHTCTVNRDHPRSRGVYGRSARSRAAVLRIIPARAGFTRRRRRPSSASADHPRSRGVYRRRRRPQAGRQGSSPLARGLPFRRLCFVRTFGIIPARAGFTAPRARRARRDPDHPRSRGVYRASPTLSQPSRGSSPLARGLPRRRRQRPRPRGIIPARAGFTGRRRRGRGSWWDHPRSRGGYGAALWARVARAGSSPLARGLPGPRPEARVGGRIIPARAGFTFFGCTRALVAKDHPRSRGVYPEDEAAAGPRVGSSPLARGLPRSPCARSMRRRIIPARAGFTRCGTLADRMTLDHPRSRGVYGVIRITVARWEGSSPLARGLLGDGDTPEIRDGIIPARAGFTATEVAVVAGTADHPRSRGVYHGHRIRTPLGLGSSPLARGLPPRAVLPAGCRGIIPARAGFTTTGGSPGWVPGDHPRSRGVYRDLKN